MLKNFCNFLGTICQFFFVRKEDFVLFSAQTISEVLSYGAIMIQCAPLSFLEAELMIGKGYFIS